MNDSPPKMLTIEFFPGWTYLDPEMTRRELWPIRGGTVTVPLDVYLADTTWNKPSGAGISLYGGGETYLMNHDVYYPKPKPTAPKPRRRFKTRK